MRAIHHSAVLLTGGCVAGVCVCVRLRVLSRPQYLLGVLLPLLLLALFTMVGFLQAVFRATWDLSFGLSENIKCTTHYLGSSQMTPFVTWPMLQETPAFVGGWNNLWTVWGINEMKCKFIWRWNVHLKAYKKKKRIRIEKRKLSLWNNVTIVFTAHYVKM